MSIDNPKFRELTTSVEGLVVLFKDPKHKLFGNIGKLILHDWKEYGQYYIVVLDKKEITVPDGICKGDPPSPVKLFYRYNDWENNIWDEKKQGLNSFKEEYLSLRVGDLEKLRKEYKAIFGEELG